jgi:hypothetical protein
MTRQSVSAVNAGHRFADSRNTVRVKLRPDRKTRMESDLAEVTAEVTRAQGEADAANERLARLQKEQRGLQTALDIMNGVESPAPEPALDRKAILDALAAMAPTAAAAHAINAAPSEQGGAGPLGLKPKADIVFNAPEGWTKGVLNGEEILLEPGMAVMKNSFGEEVIAKIGTVFTPMNEPVRPDVQAPILPPLTTDEEFMSDAELLDG